MAKAKFPETEARLYTRVFICMKCGARNKGDVLKVRMGKVKCRKCKKRAFRPIKKK